MSQRIIFTIVWMIVFPAVMFLINGFTLFAVDRLPSFLVGYFIWMMRFLFYSSSLFALFLGARGFLPGTKLSAMTPLNIITIVLDLITAGLVAVLTWIVFHPARRPEISITFVAYTNDAEGTPLARIAVTNLGTSEIFVYAPRIEIQSPAEPRGFTNYFQGNTNQWHKFHSTLENRASGSFVVPPPPFQSRWRLSF